MGRVSSLGCADTGRTPLRWVGRGVTSLAPRDGWLWCHSLGYWKDPLEMGSRGGHTFGRGVTGRSSSRWVVVVGTLEGTRWVVVVLLA